MSTPHFLVGKFEEHQRSQAQRFICPICNAPFHSESKLWAHAKSLHQEDLAIAEQQDVSEVRRKFSERSYASSRRNNWLFSMLTILSDENLFAQAVRPTPQSQSHRPKRIILPGQLRMPNQYHQPALAVDSKNLVILVTREIC